MNPNLNLILPKTFVDSASIVRPLFYLAGPVRGADNWQEQACGFLHYRLGDQCTVVTPNRWGPDHPLHLYRMKGDEHHFASQTDWERHYLNYASSNGCILCWLPCESKENPRTEDLPYARDTYGELGRWGERMRSRPAVGMVVGAEPDFPGLSVIAKNLAADVGDKIKIQPTLKLTVEAAIERYTELASMGLSGK